MALERSTTADYEVHEHWHVDTKDNEDHTFSGIIFSVVIKERLPVDFVEIETLSVRGSLGPLTVWASAGHWSQETPNGQPKYSSREAWTCIYRKFHPPSRRRFAKLELARRLRLKPGTETSIYVHSALDNDQAIVYDNQRSMGGVSSEDDLVVVKSGCVHGTVSGRLRRPMLTSIRLFLSWCLLAPLSQLGAPLQRSLRERAPLG